MLRSSRHLIVGSVLLAAVSPAAAQAPDGVRIQNARIDVRAGAVAVADLRALGANSDAVWMGWRVPLVNGDRALCSTWSTEEVSMRGGWLEEGNQPTPAPPVSVVRLESMSELVVMSRWRDGRPERLRVFAGDCPLDAGGRTVHWFSGATPATSLAILDALTRSTLLDTNARAVAEAAVTAIGLHADPVADSLLERLSAPDADDRVRQRAYSVLATARGARGLSRLTGLLATTTDVTSRRALVRAVSLSDQPAATDVLLKLARGESHTDIRGDAVYHYVIRAGGAGLDTTRGVIEGDSSDAVRRRAVSGISRLPDAVRVPVLLELARGSRYLEVRKEAVRALGQSTDPRATSYLEQVLGAPGL